LPLALLLGGFFLEDLGLLGELLCDWCCGMWLNSFLPNDESDLSILFPLFFGGLLPK
jgi:hypothetical protein